MANNLESKVQKQMIDLIRAYNGYVYKNAQNMYTEKGRPDLTACIPVSMKNLYALKGTGATVGLYLGVEVKRDSSKYDATEAQEIVGKKIRSAGGIWLATDDIDYLEALLVTLKGGPQ